MITVKKVSNFDGMGLEAPVELIKKNISKNLNYVIEIVESERIIKLNIPWKVF